MKKQLLLGIALGLLTIPALAQSSFAGFYGQISTGYESNKLSEITGSSVETPSDGMNLNASGPSQNFGGVPLVLGLGYYWQAHSSWLIGIGVDYSAISQKSSPWTNNVTNAAGSNLIPTGTSMASNGSSVQLSNRSNFFISPSYVIDKDKLLYLKAGYSQVTSKENLATSVTVVNGSGRSTTIGTTTAGASNSSTVGGYLIGLGYKQMISSGLYGFAEANYMGYGTLKNSYSSNGNSASKTDEGVSNSSVTNITGSQNLNSYQFLVGVGYSF